MGTSTNDTWRRYISLVLALASVSMVGTILTFSAFGEGLKQEFNLDQTAVETIASVGNLGSSLGYPAGLIYERIGHVNAYVLALVLSICACVLMFSTQYHVAFYHSNWGLLVVYWTLYGLSTVFMFLTTSAVTLDNFPQRHRGRISGALASFFWFGPTVFSFVYTFSLHTEPVGSFFGLLACFIVPVNILSICLIRPVPLCPEDEEEAAFLIPKHVSFIQEVENEEEKEESWQDRFGFTDFKLPEFQLLTWGFLCSGCIQLMYIFSVTTFIESYQFTGFAEYYPVVGPVFAMTAAVLSGMISDSTLKWFSRVVYLVVGAALQTIALTVSIFVGDNEVIFLITTLTIYTFNGMLWSLAIALMGEFFGMKHFSRNWGVELFGTGILTIASCAVFGELYRDSIVEADATECFGLICFDFIYMMSSTVSLVSTLLLASLWFREHKRALAIEYKLLSSS